MPAYTQIIRDLGQEKFLEVFSASSRQARETYLHRHGVRKAKPKKSLSAGIHQKSQRTQGLFDALQHNDDDEMSEEILRTWLLGKREMLAMALDHLKVEHDNGLTEAAEIDELFSGLKGKELDDLVAHLVEKYPREEIVAYLRFMGSEEAAKLAG